MLVGFACLCGSSDKLFYQKLAQYGHPNPVGVDLHRGKDKCLQAIESMPKFSEQQSLLNYINGSSKFVVFLGVDREKGISKWADITKNREKSNVDAEYIVANFRGR